MLRTYKPCNPTVRFLKYEFNSKLLDGVIFVYSSYLKIFKKNKGQ